MLLCVLHLQKNDKAKLSELSPKGSTPSINRILADIDGRRYGTKKELGLADSKDPMELSERLEKPKESWEKLCPGFYGWFVRNRKPLFEKSVIESARTNTNFPGLFYSNGIESQHFIEKKEQSFKREDIAEVAEILKRIVERQQNDEIRYMDQDLIVLLNHTKSLLLTRSNGTLTIQKHAGSLLKSLGIIDLHLTISL